MTRGYVERKGLTASLFLRCSSLCLSLCFSLLSVSSPLPAGEGVVGGDGAWWDGEGWLCCSSFLR